MENEIQSSDNLPTILSEDESRLLQLGYRQEFKRSLSSFSNFGLAFTILSIPTSLLPFIYMGIQTGGPKAMLITWPLVSIASIFVGLSMSEIASAYPTSGGLYFWSAKLSPVKWAPVMSFYTGIYNFLGLWGLGSGTAYECGGLIVSIFYMTGIMNTQETPQSHINYKSLVLVFTISCLVLCGYLNTFSSKAMNLIGQVCLWINILGLSINVLGTAYFGSQPRLSLLELLSTWNNSTGFNDVYVFLISILPAAMTYTGYDSAAHLAEETVGAAVAAPAAILSSILLTLPIGFITLWSLLAPVPVSMYDAISNSPNSTSTIVDIFVYTQGVMPGVLQTLVLIITTITCPYALIATHARMSYAFARDGGLPGSSFLYYLNEHKIPIRSLFIIILLDSLLILPSLFSSSLFAAMNSIGTIGTYISYSIPILLRLVKGSDFIPGPINLGKYYFPIGIISLIWMTLASIALMLPTEYVVYDPIKYKDVYEYIWHWIDVFNWAPVMVLGVYFISTVTWYTSVRQWFTGPHAISSLQEDKQPTEQDKLLNSYDSCE